MFISFFSKTRGIIFSLISTSQDKKEKMPLPRAEIRPIRPPHYADTFVGTYIISVAAASVAETATYPLDLLKTRLQIQGEASSSVGKAVVS